MFNQDKMFPGNRLEQYMPKTAAASQRAVIVGMLSKKGQSAADTIISRIRKDPVKFDHDVAAVRDLIADARRDNDLDGIKRYERLLDDIVGKSFPGRFKISAKESQAMRTVLSQSLPASKVNQRPGFSPAGTLTGEDMPIYKRLVSLKRSGATGSKRARALGELSSELFGTSLPVNHSKIKSARVAVGDIPIFQHLDRMGQKLADEVMEDVFDGSPVDGMRYALHDPRRTEDALQELYRMRDDIYDERGAIDPGKVSRVKAQSERFFPTYTFKDRSGKSTTVHGKTRLAEDVDRYMWNASREYASGSGDVSSALAAEQLDWIQPIVRGRLLEERSFGTGTGPSSGSYQLEEAHLLDDKVPDFFRSGEAQISGKRYAQLQRMIANEGDRDISSMLGYMQSQVVTEFGLSLDPEQRGSAAFILSRYTKATSSSTATTRAAAMWADAANRMHGGVKIRNTQGIKSSLKSRELVGMRGNVLNAEGGAYQIILRGFEGSRSVRFNEHSLIEAGIQAKTGAEYSMGGSMENMRRLALMTETQRRKEGRLIGQIADETYNRIHMTLNVGPENIRRLERVFGSDQLHAHEKDIIHTVVRMRKSGKSPMRIMEELRGMSSAGEFSLLDVSSTLAKATKYLSATEEGLMAWHIESIANATGAISQAVEGGMPRVDDIVGRETMHALSVNPSEAAEAWYTDLKAEVTKSRVRAKNGRLFKTYDKNNITAGEMNSFVENMMRHANPLGGTGRTDAELDAERTVKKLVDYAMNPDGTIDRDRFAMVIGEVGGKSKGKLSYSGFVGTASEDDGAFLRRTMGEAQNALHSEIGESTKRLPAGRTRAIGLVESGERDGLFSRMKALIASGELTEDEYNEWSQPMLSRIIGRFKSGSNLNARSEDIADNLLHMDITGNMSASQDVSLQQLMHEGAEGERRIQDVLGDTRILDADEMALRDWWTGDFKEELANAKWEDGLDDFGRDFADLDSEARRMSLLDGANQTRKAKFQRYWLGSIYDRMNDMGTDELRDAYSKIVSSSADVDGMRDLQFGLVDVVNHERGITGVPTERMLGVYGWDTDTGDRRAMLWRVGQDKDGRSYAKSVGSDVARSLRQVVTVGYDDVGFANETVNETLETLNLKLAANGLDVRDFERAGKRLMPGMHAAATAQEMLDAVNDIQSRAPELANVSLDAVMSTGVNEAGEAIEAGSRKTLGIVDSIVEGAVRLQSGAGIDEPFVRQLGGIETMMNANISARKIGGLPEDFVETVKNLKDARKLDPWQEAKSLVNFASDYPRTSKIAVGALAITGMGIAMRAFDHDANQTEQFLQYDHPGSEGAVRVTPNGTGYDVAGAQRGTPSAAGSVSGGNDFKGFKTTINVMDNLDGMSPNTVNRMAGM